MPKPYALTLTPELERFLEAFANASNRTVDQVGQEMLRLHVGAVVVPALWNASTAGRLDECEQELLQAAVALQLESASNL